MKIVIRAMKRADLDEYDVTWPEGWPAPRVDDTISLPDGTPLTVRAVYWFPQGDEDDPEPFVYVVAR